MASYVDIAKEVLASMSDQAEVGPPRETEMTPVYADHGIGTDQQFTLKGQAVELWRDVNRFFIVADEEDAQEAIRQFGARRGEIWARSEVELIGRFEDQAVRDQVEAVKREMDGSLTPDTARNRAGSQVDWQKHKLP